jgi:ABC-type uncharacterized transport system permease subunit
MSPLPSVVRILRERLPLLLAFHGGRIRNDSGVVNVTVPPASVF